jgi:hypothetical protein
MRSGERLVLTLRSLPAELYVDSQKAQNILQHHRLPATDRTVFSFGFAISWLRSSTRLAHCCQTPPYSRAFGKKHM